MKIYCIYSEQFVPIYQRFFEPTLRATNPDLELVTDVFKVGGNADFRSAGFNQALIYKWKRGLEAFYARNGEVVLFTDVDIIFNRPMVQPILDVLGNADVAVTPEGPGDVTTWGFNVGVLALRCGPKLRRLVSRMLDYMILEGAWDQKLFNQLLPQSGLQYRVLPQTFANGRIPYDRNSVLYHATCTIATEEKSSLEMKIDALEMAERVFRGGYAPADAGGALFSL